MKILFVIIGLLSVMACEPKIETANEKDGQTPVTIQQSPTAQFETFIALFSPIKLPFTLIPDIATDRIDDKFVSSMLGANTNSTTGIDKQAFAIGTFKVHKVTSNEYPCSVL